MWKVFVVFVQVLSGVAFVLVLGVLGNGIGYLISTQAAAIAEKPACAEPACICRVGEAFACSRFSGIACAGWVKCPDFKEPCDGPPSKVFPSQLRR